MSRGESQPAAVAGPGARTRRRGRVRRWGRRLALALLVLVIAVTLAAVVYDLASNGEMQPASSLYGGPFVRVDGTLLAYRKWGRGGSPVVLLGGAAEPSWVWHTVGPLLARADHRVFALDLPPFGYSQRRGPYTMANWLQLLQRFERHFNLRRPVLVGHSLGAGVAAAAGLAHPSRVAGVVLLDGDALAFGGNHARLADLLVYPYYTALYRIVTGSDWIVGRALSNAWGPDPPRSTRQRSPSSNAPSGSREPTPRSSSSSQAASLASPSPGSPTYARREPSSGAQTTPWTRSPAAAPPLPRSTRLSSRSLAPATSPCSPDPAPWPTASSTSSQPPATRTPTCTTRRR